MARQMGPIKLEGTISDLVFYKGKDGWLVRTKESRRGELIKKDPRFARVRENSTEFVNAVQSGKLLRDAVRGILKKATDKRLTPRLTQLMSSIQKLDTISKRGSRNAGTALLQPEAKAMLEGFEFTSTGKVCDILLKHYTVNEITGVITIEDFIPVDDIRYAKRATHLLLSGAVANVDFTERTSAIKFTNTVTLPIDNNATTVNLAPVTLPPGAGIQLVLLKIEMLQDVNGALYGLNDDGFTGMRIVRVG